MFCLANAKYSILVCLFYSELNTFLWYSSLNQCQRWSLFHSSDTCHVSPCSLHTLSWVVHRLSMSRVLFGSWLSLSFSDSTSQCLYFGRLFPYSKKIIFTFKWISSKLRDYLNMKEQTCCVLIWNLDLSWVISKLRMIG